MTYPDPTAGPDPASYPPYQQPPAQQGGWSGPAPQRHEPRPPAPHAPQQPGAYPAPQAYPAQYSPQAYPAQQGSYPPPPPPQYGSYPAQPDQYGQQPGTPPVHPYPQQPGGAPQIPPVAMPYQKWTSDDRAQREINLAEDAAQGKRDITVGGIWLGVGVFITFATMSSGASFYVVAWGPMLYGLYRLIKGIIAVRRAG